MIPKSVHKDRQKENLEAVNLDLSNSQMEEINALNKNLRFVDGTFFTQNGSPYTLKDIWGA